LLVKGTFKNAKALGFLSYFFSIGFLFVHWNFFFFLNKSETANYCSNRKDARQRIKV